MCVYVCVCVCTMFISRVTYTWIGLRRKVNDGPLFWASGVPFSYSNWHDSSWNTDPVYIYRSTGWIQKDWYQSDPNRLYIPYCEKTLSK